MTEIDREWEHQNWAKKIARYYVNRGRDFSVEINPSTHFDFLLSLLEIGVKKFYFVWGGVRKDFFIAAFDVLTIAKYAILLYPDITITIIYAIRYSDHAVPPLMEMVLTSIFTITHMTKDIPLIKLMFRYPHPWCGRVRQMRLREIENWIDKSSLIKEMVIEPLCGCITITPNTNIYPCEFCKRRKRKKLFGNAQRDKHVCGTIDRGIFRDIECDVCGYGGKNKVCLKHKPVGGE